MPFIKTHAEIVDEALKQVKGVFEHYTDQKLEKTNLDNIKASLEANIPQNFTTESWSAYAEEKRKEYEEQS